MREQEEQAASHEGVRGDIGHDVGVAREPEGVQDPTRCEGRGTEQVPLGIRRISLVPDTEHHAGRELEQARTEKGTLHPVAVHGMDGEQKMTNAEGCDERHNQERARADASQEQEQQREYEIEL